MEFHKLPGFLGNLAEFYELVEMEGAVWQEFVAVWAKTFGEKEVGVASLFTYTALLDFNLGSNKDVKAQKIKFGIMLKAHRDQIFDGYRIT